jgi:hypothetical protein
MDSIFSFRIDGVFDKLTGLRHVTSADHFSLCKANEQVEKESFHRAQLSRCGVKEGVGVDFVELDLFKGLSDDDMAYTGDDTMSFDNFEDGFMDDDFDLEDLLENSMDDADAEFRESVE